MTPAATPAVIEYVNGMITIVRKAGTEDDRSSQSMCRTCVIIIDPMTTSAAAATWLGTMPAIGVKNSIRPNRPPTTTLDRPVRAPSPTPVADSTNTVCPDEPVTPPMTPPAPSTARALLRPGMRPFSSTSFASEPMPMIVAIASKKPAKTSVNTSTDAVIAPASPNPPNTLTSPISEKSGVSTTLSGNSGTPSPHAFAGTSTTAFTIIATTVPMTSPIRIAPRIRRAISMKMASSVTAKTTTGQPLSSPAGPSTTGPPPGAAFSCTKPAFTMPIMATNRPMPMVMACFTDIGMAFMIVSRRPEKTMIMMIAP